MPVFLCDISLALEFEQHRQETLIQLLYRYKISNQQHYYPVLR